MDAAETGASGFTDDMCSSKPSSGHHHRYHHTVGFEEFLHDCGMSAADNASGASNSSHGYAHLIS